MKILTIRDAEKKLSRLIEEARGGKEIIIIGDPGSAVRLVPIANAKGSRQPGRLKGKLHVGPEFFEPCDS